MSCWRVDYCCAELRNDLARQHGALIVECGHRRRIDRIDVRRWRPTTWKRSANIGRARDGASGVVELADLVVFQKTIRAHAICLLPLRRLLVAKLRRACCRGSGLSVACMALLRYSQRPYARYLTDDWATSLPLRSEAVVCELGSGQDGVGRIPAAGV